MRRAWVWAIAAYMLSIAARTRGALPPRLYSIAYDMNHDYRWWIRANAACQGRYLTHAAATGRVSLASPAGDLTPPLWRVEPVKGKRNQFTLMATGSGTLAGKYLSYKRKACGDATVFLGNKTAWTFTPNQFARPDDQYGYGAFSPVDRDACGNKAPLLLAPDLSRRPEWSGSCSPPFSGISLALNSTLDSQAQRWLLMPYTGAFPKPLYGNRSPWSEDKFGASVAAGADDIVAAGEYGGAYVFQKKGFGWQRQALRVGPTDQPDRFLRQVAAAKNYVAVARPRSTTAVLLFARPWATGRPSAALKPPVGSSARGFGASIDMNDAFLAVGDPDVDPKRRGAVYVSSLNGSKWGALKALPVPAGASRFGSFVKLSGPTLAVTASKNVTYVFAWDRTKGWALQSQVRTSYAPSSVGLAGGTLVTISSDVEPGVAQIFRRNGTQWVLDATIASPGCINAPVACEFSATALRDEGTLVLARSSDPREDVGSYGAVYVRNATTGKWVKKQKLSHIETGWDLWGRAVAVKGNTLVVGAAGTAGEYRKRRRQLLARTPNYYNIVPGTAYVYKLEV